MGRLAGFQYRQIVKRPGDLPEGTLRAILQQAGVTQEEFLAKKPRSR